MTVQFSAPSELLSRLDALRVAMGLSRAALIRKLLHGALNDTEAIERWKDAVLGPRFDIMRQPPPRSDG